MKAINWKNAKVWVPGSLLVTLAALAGCSLLGSNPSPPSKFEQRFFAIETNLVNQVVTVTNTVLHTNEVVATVTVTNTEHQVVQVPVTNYTTVPVPVVVTVTNSVEQYTYKPNTNAASVSNAVGGLAGLSGIPGAGTIASLVATGLWGLWGTLRSSRKGKTAASLAQVIEVGREVLARTPQGQQASDVWTNWMVQHQAETGVIQDVIKILPNAVDNPAAKEVADQLMGLIQQQQRTPATAKA